MQQTHLAAVTGNLKEIKIIPSITIESTTRWYDLRCRRSSAWRDY